MDWIIGIISVIGGVLNAYGKISGFYFWIIANIGWIIYCISNKFYGQIPMWFVFLVIAVLGIVEWKKKEIG